MRARAAVDSAARAAPSVDRFTRWRRAAPAPIVRRPAGRRAAGGACEPRGRSVSASPRDNFGGGRAARGGGAFGGYGSGRQTSMDSSRGASSRGSMASHGGGGGRSMGGGGGAWRRRWRRARRRRAPVGERRDEPADRNRQGTNPMNPTKIMTRRSPRGGGAAARRSAVDVRGGAEDLRHARGRRRCVDGGAQGR